MPQNYISIFDLSCVKEVAIKDSTVDLDRTITVISLPSIAVPQNCVTARHIEARKHLKVSIF
jgi:hypothetical protein